MSDNLPVPIEDLRPEAYISDMRRLLSKEEQVALEEYLRSGVLPIATVKAVEMMNLFLAGSTCKEILKVNPGFSLGQILDARIRNKWDLEYSNYVSDLLARTRDKVTQARLETIDLMTDALTAAKKLHGAKYKKYIQSGDPKDLEGAMKIDTIKGIKDTVEGIMKATGEDRNFTIKNINEDKTSVDVNINASSGESVDSQSAAQILKILSESKRAKK